MGHAFHNVSLSAYYPVFGTDDKRNHLDYQGKILNTLQVSNRDRRNVIFESAKTICRPFSTAMSKFVLGLP